MNSNKISKIKGKFAPSFDMGQKNALPKKSQSCSIFSVDEDVKFVVDDNEDSFPTVVPVECELSSETYTEKQIITYSTMPQSKQPFKFSFLPDLHVLSCKPSGPRSKFKFTPNRGPDGTFISNPLKKASRPHPAISSSFSRDSITNNTPNTSFHENEISSDSDIEVVEVKVVNPNSMSNFMGKAFRSHIDSNNKRKLAHPPRRKNGTHIASEQVNKPCFMAGNDLIINEADTAPLMPNNPLFNDVHSVPKIVNWRNTSNSMEISCYNEQSIVKEQTSCVSSKSSPKKEIKTSPTDPRTIISKELKSLYDNLNEISWTQESSFKNLLQNPDYIRHSERSTGRIAGTGKTPRNVKSSDDEPAIKNKNAKEMNLAKDGSKKINLTQSNPNKKLLAIKASPSTTDDKKLHVPKLAKPKIRTPGAIFNNKLVKNKKKKISQKGKKDKIQRPNKKIKLMAPPNLKSSSKCIKTENPENFSCSKVEKKHISSSNQKMKVQVKKEGIKLKKEKIAKSVTSKERKKATPFHKVEISEASSSGLHNSVCKDTSFSARKASHKNGNIKNYFSKEDLSIKRCERSKDEIKNYYSRELSVRVQPLEYTPHWKSLNFEDLRKTFMNEAIYQASSERREPNGIILLLQKFCDTYLMSTSADDKISKKKKPEEETLRSSARQINGAFRYKDIAVKKFPDYIHIILVSNMAKKNILTTEAIKELKEVFLNAKKDPKCKAVLLSSGGSYFCRGIDLSVLIGPNKKQACEEMASVIRDLILVLGSFTKPVVAAVNGAAVGFGVSLLTHCDVVLASDKASFFIPSTSLGYMAEGGLTLTLPQIVGSIRCSEMLLQGKKLTAQEAHARGLVNEVLWPSHFMNEVMPRFETILTQTIPVMEATKLLVRANIWDKLRVQMDFERKLLVGQWLSADCQEKMKKYLRHNTYIDD